MNLVQNFIRQIAVKHPSSGVTSTKNTDQSSQKQPKQKSIQVCLLGGHTNLGKMTSFLLKQNPLLSTVKMHGTQGIVKQIENDLNLIDTRCKVETYLSDPQIPNALRGVDIVLVLKGKEYQEDVKLTDIITSEAKRVFKIAKACTLYAPRSIILVAVPPVSVFTPLVAEVFKNSNFYRPQRIIGSAAIAQTKLNVMVGRYHDLDPYVCQVPIVGGPDIDLAVPLFSRAEPVELNYVLSECLTGRFRRVKSSEFPKKYSSKYFLENHDISEAYALNNMISTICYGLLGDDNAFYNGFMRSDLVPACKYLVTTLKFGLTGVSLSCGMPKLTNFELNMLERAIIEISKREQMAKEIVDYLEGFSEVSSLINKGKQKKKQL